MTTSLTISRYEVAISALKADKVILAALASVVPWGMIHNAAVMAVDDKAWQWGEEYDMFSANEDYGIDWNVSDTHATIRRKGYRIEARSTSGHSVELDIIEGEVTRIDSGTESSTTSFGHALPPIERVRHIADGLRKQGIKVELTATKECEERIATVNKIKSRLTKAGPERPDTRVKKAIKEFPYYGSVVRAIAAELWPLSYGNQVW
jgi:hypothetical protein